MNLNVTIIYVCQKRKDVIMSITVEITVMKGDVVSNLLTWHGN